MGSGGIGPPVLTSLLAAGEWSATCFCSLNWFMHPVARVSINKYRNLRTQQIRLPPIGAETCRGKMHTKLFTTLCCVRRLLYLLIDASAGLPQGKEPLVLTTYEDG
jgi:hypothetical protein